MQQFRATGLAVALNVLNDYICECERRKLAGEVQAGTAMLAFVNHALSEAESVGKNNPAFAGSKSKATLILLHYKQHTPDLSTIAADLRNVRDVLMHDVWSLQFLQVDAKHKKDIENENFLGAVVATKFPSAKRDIQDAGNAIAVGFPNAAVFHLMRVTEWGLRALAVHLGFTRLKSKIKKSGRTTYTPLAYTEWEKILDQLQDKVDVKMGRLKRGTAKQKLQEFYYPALQDLRALRDAWRNHIMHTRSSYEESDAKAVLDHVKRLMGTLATRVREV